jgi:protoporphyrinogen oxidase
MTGASRHIGIVGGGVLGMTLALRLAQRGHRVTLIEGASATGGLTAPQEIGGFTWDRFYHVILLSDLHLRALLDELELTSALHWRTTRTGFFVGGRLHSMSNSLDFLRFPPLGPVDKLRLVYTILRAARETDGRRLEGITATEWLERLSGRRTLERIWLPLLVSKLGENYRVASAAFIWAIIARLYGARRSGLKREMFGYVDGGYSTILARFRERLADIGVETRCGHPVVEVAGSDDEVSVRTTSGEQHAFDDVILTVPCPQIATICPQLTDAERARLRGVVYQGIACASLLLRKPLASYYVTNLVDGGLPFTAVVEMTTLVDAARFGGHSLVYLPRYMTQDDAFWARSDDEIRAEFLAALARMYPAFRADDVVAFRLSRVRYMLAVSTLHYSDRLLPPLGTSIPGVYIVNSAQIAHGTLNVNETLALANTQSARLASVLGARAAEARLA